MIRPILFWSLLAAPAHRLAPRKKNARCFATARVSWVLWGKRALVGRGCRRRRWDVRLLREAALALGFADVSHGAVEIGVRTVGPAVTEVISDL